MRRFLSILLALGSILAIPVIVVLPGSLPLSLLWRMPLIYMCFVIWQIFRAVYITRLFARLGIRPEEAGLVYEEVEFPSQDGLRLHGWFLPGERTTPIILAHPSSGSTYGMVHHARFLHQAGYPVLMVDLRGHGSSQSSPTTFGVREAGDIRGAVDYLRTREEVDASRIGVLGLSLGAQAVLRAAVGVPEIQAVVVEGLGPAGLADHDRRARTLRRWINLPINWFNYSLANWMAGISTPESTADVLAQLHRPLLLISASMGLEPYFNEIFYEAAHSPRWLWVIPRSYHASGYFMAKEEYKQQVLQFFQRALLLPIDQTPGIG